MPLNTTLPANIFNDVDGSIFVQEDPGTTTYWIGPCYTGDALANPRGGIDPIWCFDNKRNPAAIGYTQSTPGKITHSLTGVIEAEADWLEKFVENHCPFWLHYIQTKCGDRGVHGIWDRSWTIKVDRVVDDPVSGLQAMGGGGHSEHAYNLEGMPPRIDSRRMTASALDGNESEEAWDVWTAPAKCRDTCSGPISEGEYVYVGYDGNAGTPTVDYSVNYGATFATSAATTFGIGDHIKSGQTFENITGGLRTLVVGDNVAGAAPMTVEYSDSATLAAWTAVTVEAGGVNNEGGTMSQCLFAIDWNHIWLCTSLGNVFFSDDGGATWTDQDAATASGGLALNAIHFYNYNVGYAVGAGANVITTSNGGDTWTALTNEPGAGILHTVQVLDPAGQIVVTGGADGAVYHTWDGGASAWTITTADPSTESVRCIEFCNPMTGLMARDTDVPVGAILHTVDGGYSWHAFTTPTNTKENAVTMVTPSYGYACGNAAAPPSILRISSGHISA